MDPDVLRALKEAATTCGWDERHLAFAIPLALRSIAKRHGTVRQEIINQVIIEMRDALRQVDHGD